MSWHLAPQMRRNAIIYKNSATEVNGNAFIASYAGVVVYSCPKSTSLTIFYRNPRAYWPLGRAPEFHGAQHSAEVTPGLCQAVTYGSVSVQSPGRD